MYVSIFSNLIACCWICCMFYSISFLLLHSPTLFWIQFNVVGTHIFSAEGDFVLKEEEIAKCCCMRELQDMYVAILRIQLVLLVGGSFGDEREKNETIN